MIKTPRGNWACVHDRCCYLMEPRHQLDSWLMWSQIGSLEQPSSVVRNAGPLISCLVTKKQPAQNHLGFALFSTFVYFTNFSTRYFSGFLFVTVAVWFWEKSLEVGVRRLGSWPWLCHLFNCVSFAIYIFKAWGSVTAWHCLFWV